MTNAVDLATKLNATTAANLFKNGVRYVGRYLGHTWKGLEVAEVAAIKGAGLQLFSIFEKAATQVSYFTAAQGQADALEAYRLAKELGQPEGTAIYFTVDFDSQMKDLSAILTYFKAVRDNLKGYAVGAYGSYTTLQFLQVQNVATYFFQTVAWSHNQHCKFNNLFQFQCDKTFAGLQVDLVNLEKADVGAWGQDVPYKVIIPNVNFSQAKALVIEFEGRGYKCSGVNLKVYGPNEHAIDSDPYWFVIETTLETAKQLVIELKTRGYDRTYGEEIK